VPVEHGLVEIATKICPDKPNVLLHASDLWHGSGDFPRSQFDQLVRRGTVEAIARLIADFDLPVVFGKCERAKLAPLAVHSKSDQEISDALPHILSQHSCSLVVEAWMRRNAAEEVAQLVHEDIPRSKKSLKLFHNLARDPMGRVLFGGKLPFYTHIRGPLYYADKYEERLLQLADTCAFVISRHVEGHQDVLLIFEILKPRIVELERSMSL
jgi:hypothetical protein